MEVIWSLSFVCYVKFCRLVIASDAIVAAILVWSTLVNQRAVYIPMINL